jgi:hypothetical protein
MQTRHCLHLSKEHPLVDHDRAGQIDDLHCGELSALDRSRPPYLAHSPFSYRLEQLELPQLQHRSNPQNQSR